MSHVCIIARPKDHQRTGRLVLEAGAVELVSAAAMSEQETNVAVKGLRVMGTAVRTDPARVEGSEAAARPNLLRPTVDKSGTAAGVDGTAATVDGSGTAATGGGAAPTGAHAAARARAAGGTRSVPCPAEAC